MKKRAEVQATLELHDSGQWVLRLKTETPEGVETVKAMLLDTGYMRDHMHVFILTQCGGLRPDKVVELDFNVDEGPDIVGRQSEILKLQAWKP